ncbi:MAG: hypothetical protein AAFQ79_00720 [Pseudomonadota bacterium]
MIAKLTEKARANRLAALQHVAVRKSKLVSLSDFRGSSKHTSTSPVVGFVSSRSVEDSTIAA